jgi:ribose transport system permease protein
VTGGAPDWLIELTSVQGRVAGVPVPPLVVVWVVIAAAVILVLRRSAPGIAVYALGSSRAAAERARLRARACWVGLYVLSAVAAATAGMLLLGFTTGGFADVGKPYLFSTVAAVVIGGTSLLGGKGGYGLTIIGSLSLVALTTILLGAGLSTPAQQVVLGVAIIAMVSLYGREPALTARV